MIKGFFSACVLGVGIGMYAALPAQAAGPALETPSAGCGQELSARDVLVLDLQHMGKTPELAQDYVLEQAGDYRLAQPLIQEFRMKKRPSIDPGGLDSGARRMGARRGCDLVLVLKTGPYLGKQRGRNTRIKDQGYALVAIGQRVPAEL